MILALLLALTCRTATADVEDVEVATLFADTVHDFGVVPRGSVNVHRFVLTNTTDQTIRIDKLALSCNCTTALLMQQSAAPGEEIVIEAAYSTHGFVGERQVSIHVDFAEPRQRVTLQVRGTSRGDLAFSPERIDLGSVPQGRTATGSLQVHYTGAEEWRLVKAVAAENLDVNVQPLGDHGYRVTATLKPDAPPGRLSRTIALHTTDPRQPVVRVDVAGAVEPPLKAEPPLLDVGTVVAGRTVRRRVMLRGREPFAVTAVAGDTAGVAVSSSLGQRTVHIVDIDFTPDEAGPIDRVLKVRTDLPDSPPLEIPLVGKVGG